MNKQGFASEGLDKSAWIIGNIKHLDEHVKSVDFVNSGASSSQYVSNASMRIYKAVLKQLGYELDPKTADLANDNQVCEPQTYLKLMYKYRGAIKAQGVKHHTLENKLIALFKKHDEDYQDVSKIRGIDKAVSLSKFLAFRQSMANMRESYILLMSGLNRQNPLRIDLAKIKIEHHLFYLFLPHDCVADRQKEKSKIALNEKDSNQVLINATWVKTLSESLINGALRDTNGADMTLTDYVNIRKKSARPKKKPYTDLVIGLALACGRRATELMRTGTFTPAILDNHLLFGGQLKTKNRYLFEEIAAYEVPIIIDLDLFLEGFELLRRFGRTESVKYIDSKLGQEVSKPVVGGDIKDARRNAAVVNRYAKPLNDRIKQLLSSPEFTFKDARAIYSEISYADFKNGESSRSFKNRVLGHSGQRLNEDTGKLEDVAAKTSQAHYAGFELSSEIDTVKFLTGSRKDSVDNDNKPMGDKVLDHEFLDFLERKTPAINSYARAPIWAGVHAWFILQVKAGMNRDNILAEVAASNRKTSGVAWVRTYMRKNLLIDNKGVSPASLKNYLVTDNGLGLSDNLDFDGVGK
jgi:hypothetical protein